MMPIGHKSQLSWHTARLTRPHAGTLVWTALFLVVFFLLGELIVRIDVVAAILGAPGLGSEHQQFEEQWARLQSYVGERGSVDCLVLGDSTVMSDFSPTAFAESYREESGEELACYNFGVGAISVAGAATLAKLLDEAYSPQLFVVGLEPLNFTVPLEGQGAADFASVPWIQYRLGRFSVEGWAYEHLHFLGYMKSINRILKTTVYNTGITLPGMDEEAKFVAGYSPLQGRGPFDITQPPDPSVDHPYIEHYYAAHGSYEMLPENLEALEQILAMSGSTTQIVLVEMPLTKTFDAFFGRGAQDHQYFVRKIGDRGAANGVPFVRLADPELIPPSGWYNYNHLNAEGASIFSRWLGQQVGPAAHVRQD